MACDHICKVCGATFTVADEAREALARMAEAMDALPHIDRQRGKAKTEIHERPRRFREWDNACDAAVKLGRRYAEEASRG